MHPYQRSNSFIHSIIYSGHFYSASSSPLLLRGAPDYSTDTISEFHAEAHRQLQVKDLSKDQGPYVTARAGGEPTTLRLKVIASTNAPPRPTNTSNTNIYTYKVYIMVYKWLRNIYTIMFCSFVFSSVYITGGNLGGLGDGPPKV